MIDSLTRTGLRILEDAINKALDYDPGTRAAIAKLAGKVFLVESTLPPLHFYGGHGEDGRVRLMTEWEGEPDTRLKGTAVALAALAADRSGRTSFVGTGVEVRGNHDLLIQVRQLMQNLDIDWEAALAGLIGDVPAHLVGQAVRGAVKWQQQAGIRAGSGLADFAREEIGLTVGRSEMAQFEQEVRHLSNDTDRLDARIKRLRLRLAQKADEQEQGID